MPLPSSGEGPGLYEDFPDLSKPVPCFRVSLLLCSFLEAGTLALLSCLGLALQSLAQGLAHSWYLVNR